jgi:pimeloyl-ACP methyl ester carboxylesterase
MMRRPVVLVHGAFRGGWAWRDVRRILQAAGVETFAPSLTGAGERVHLLNADIGLDVWARDVSNLLWAEDLNGAVLVGHSQGGLVIQAAAELAPERIARLIFVDAPILKQGESAFDLLQAEFDAPLQRPDLNALLQPRLIEPGDGVSADYARWANERLTPSPVRPGFDAVMIERSAGLPRQIVFCAETPSTYPAAIARRRCDRDGVTYQLLNAPHDCLHTHADELARLILDHV